MTKKVKSKVLEIMTLALDFNSESTKQEYTGNKPTLFVQFYGHTCQLDVDIATEGWGYRDGRNVRRNVRNEIYLDRTSAVRELNKTLKTLKAVIAEYEERENR